MVVLRVQPGETSSAESDRLKSTTEPPSSAAGPACRSASLSVSMLTWHSKDMKARTQETGVGSSSAVPISPAPTATSTAHV